MQNFRKIHPLKYELHIYKRLQDFCLRRVSDRFPILLRVPGFAVDLTNQYNGCIAPMNCSIKLSTWDWDVLHLRIRLRGSRKILWCGRLVCAEDLNRVSFSETLGLDLWLFICRIFIKIVNVYFHFLSFDGIPKAQAVEIHSLRRQEDAYLIRIMPFLPRLGDIRSQGISKHGICRGSMEYSIGHMGLVDNPNWFMIKWSFYS